MVLYIVLSVLIIIVSLLLIGIVLVQKSKGGGLASSFAGANQVLGVRHTNSAIEKITWWLIGVMWLLCVLASFALPIGNTTTLRVNQEETQQALPTGGFDTPAQDAPVQEAPAQGE